jgi:hypothetical protein
MDIDGFVIFLAGIGNIDHMNNNVFTIGISGISWNQVVTRRKEVKGTQHIRERETISQKLYHQKKI